ncbi:MAG: hypothetical protein HY905_13025 [Deltaproteobacteria bacterium]|nr:hypothetical protein [Deltaproteobacteria bacterium]
MALVAALAALAAACHGPAPAANSPEEEVELARAKTNAADLLRARLVDPASPASVRLRAIRGLVEVGRVDQLRQALRELPADQARVLVEQSVPNITWLAMASSVPDGRLRQSQVFAKDALLMIGEWMSPAVRRDATAVVVRWFVSDPVRRADQGSIPLARLESGLRTAVAEGLTLGKAKIWSDVPAIAALVMSIGSDPDRKRLREEAADAYVRAPWATPEQRAETRAGVLAALRGLSGDAAALKAGQQGRPLPEPDNAPLADLAGLREKLAAVIRAPAEPVAARLEALSKMLEVGYPLRPHGLLDVVTDEKGPVEVRAAVAAQLCREGDPAAAAAAALAVPAEVFAATAPNLRHVKIAGQIPAFAEALAAGRERIASLTGRCDALVDALAGMGPRRSATTAGLLLAGGDSFIMSFGVAVLARVGTPDDKEALSALTDSEESTACWPDRTVGQMAAQALEQIAGRGEAPGTSAAGDEDGG